MVTIRANGEDTVCKSQVELRAKLTQSFKNKSITLIYERPSGIKTPLYVDVCSQGNLTGSYNFKEIPFDTFNSVFTKKELVPS